MSRLRQRLQVLLHVDDSPHRIALAFAVGVWVAFFPILGIHTGMALAIAFAFRLSRVAILLGTWLNNPWTIAPMYTAGLERGGRPRLDCSTSTTSPRVSKPVSGAWPVAETSAGSSAPCPSPASAASGVEPGTPASPRCSWRRG